MRYLDEEQERVSVDRQERTLPYVTVWRWHSDAVIAK